MYFPGGYGRGQDPFDNYLAWITIRALEQSGAYVLPTRYDDNVLEPDPERFEAGVRREVRGALAFHRPDRLTILGKSRGTQALRLVSTEEFDFPADTRLIWQTPTWKSDRCWEAAKQGRFESLYVVGLADHHYHVPERHKELRGQTVAIAGADHGLEVAGDIVATLDGLRDMAVAIVRFANRA
jgi:hypothetical protein